MRYPLPLLLCLALLAPTCMAQSHDQEDEPAANEPAADEPPRRSAMGRVMGIMIETLRQEALRDDSDTGAGAPVVAGHAEAPQAEARQVIEVGAAFRLPPEPVDAATPGCDVQPCDREQPQKLRIASQK